MKYELLKHSWYCYDCNKELENKPRHCIKKKHHVVEMQETIKMFNKEEGNTLIGILGIEKRK